MVVAQSSTELYQQYVGHLRKIADVKNAAAVLQWDQETYLPENGAEMRGQQLATLSEMAHELFVNEKLGHLLKELSQRGNLDEKQQKNIELSLRDHNKVRKFSSSFIREMSETTSLAYHQWINARRQNDHKIFEPSLRKIVTLKKKEADILGYTEHRYDALLNEYEPGATVKMLDNIFNEVKEPLKNLLEELLLLPQPDTAFLHQKFLKEEQWKWGQQLAAMLGFNFKAGRQDVSEHPFSTSFNTSDVRITTRIDENDLSNITWSTIHEVGHALYEQGLPPQEYGLPTGEYASLSIHESQSRLWENCVGRSMEFWKFYFPQLKNIFPQQLKNVTVEHFVRSINKIKPSLIRTEADELTYHFHVMIRYDLEKLLIAGEIQVADIPAYWSEQYEKLLGVTVPNDLTGCLQDVHWSHGSFGYFATYSLGSFYAAQFYEQAQIEIPQLLSFIENKGDTSTLLSWLRTKVHVHGRFYNSEELCRTITGSGLDSKIFVDQLRQKIKALY